jgi:hypothetical protein
MIPARVIPAYRNADSWNIHPMSPHLNVVVDRLNRFMRGYELGRMRFNTTTPFLPPQTDYVRLTSPLGAQLTYWYGAYALVIPVTHPNIALPLEGFDLGDQTHWGTVEFLGADFVKVIRPIALPGGPAYEHDVLWRRGPLPD